MLITLVAFAGCAKMESAPAPEQAVSFEVARYARTKAVAITEFTSFSSKAFLYAEGVDGVQMFFGNNGETITWRPATSEWTPSHPYYWPKGEESYINFVSWRASEGIVPTTVTETSFVVTRTVEADDQLLIADEAWRCTSNLTTYRFNGVVSGVPTLFHHVLAKVQVNMKMTTETDPDDALVTYEVVLQNARIEGLYDTGTLSLTNSDPSASETRAWAGPASNAYLWTLDQNSNGNDVVMVSSSTSLSETPTAILPERSFIPQALGNGIVLHLTYTVTTKSNGVVTSSETDIPAEIKLNTIKNLSNVAITDWLPNTIYNYNLIINPISKQILLEPLVESEWDFADDINVTVE